VRRGAEALSCLECQGRGARAKRQGTAAAPRRLPAGAGRRGPATPEADAPGIRLPTRPPELRQAAAGGPPEGSRGARPRRTRPFFGRIPASRPPPSAPRSGAGFA